MQKEKIDIAGISYAFCDSIEDFLSQCENDNEAVKEIRKDKDLIFFAKEIKNYFNDNFKEMDKYYNDLSDWDGYSFDAVSGYIKTFFK